MPNEYRLLSRDASIDDQYIRHYTHTYQVLTSEYNLDAGAVAAIVPIAMFAAHPVDNRAYVRSKSAKPVSGQLGIWEVTLEYDSRPQDPAKGETQQNNQNEAPEDRPPTISFESEQSTKPLMEDLNGDAVTNSVGMLYDPPLTVPVTHPVINIQYMSATFDPESIAYYTNKTNNAPLSIFNYSWPARTLLCTKYSASSVFEQGGMFWNISVSLKVALQDQNGDYIEWDKIKGIDSGTHKLVSGKPPQPITDKTGSPITSPVPLNGNGQPLLSGQAPVYREHRAYAEVSFTSILG
jgi:hypothetical protein